MADCMSAERANEVSLDNAVDGSIESFESALRGVDCAIEIAGLHELPALERVLISVRIDLEYGLAWQAQGR